MHDVAKLKKMANLIRKDIVKMLASAGSGHSAGALGMVDVFTALYFYLLKHDPKNPDWEDRDRLILSNGHICPVLYACLARSGYFPVDELDSLRSLGGRLQGHPARRNAECGTLRSEVFGVRHGIASHSLAMTGEHKPVKTAASHSLAMTGDHSPVKTAASHSLAMTDSSALPIDSQRLIKEDNYLDNHNLPGVENVSGPLGQGVSQAVGVALGLRMDGKKNEVICVMGDGEQQEGQVWEALMMASKYRLSNLTFVVDRNSIQIDGYTYDVMPLEPLKMKYEAFGLDVLEVDGHNFDEIVDAFHKSKAMYGRPVVIIAHTIPGKDVEYMEDDYRWHGKVPGIGETVEALRELSIDK